MTNTYTDSITYLKQPTGLQVAGFVGISARLQAMAALGATSLSIPNTMTVPLYAYDSIYLFDGASSEIVQAASYVAPGATSITLLAGTAFAHSAGTPFCTDGASGSLGEQIFTASARIESEICHQALWSTAYTSEILTMPTMRAALDNQGNLHFRPRHYPITALSSVTVMVNQQYNWVYDTTQAIIDSDQQTVDLPQIALKSNGGGISQFFTGSPWLWPAMDRQRNAWITLGYTAGFATGALPTPIIRACGLLTSVCFIQLTNPIGADDIGQESQHITFTLRGDQTGVSLLEKEALRLLQPYVIEAF